MNGKLRENTQDFKEFVFFIWTVLKQRLLTNAERVQREIGADPSYLFCGHGLEDVLHVFRDCSATKDVRLSVLLVNQKRAFFLDNLHERLVSNLQDCSKMHEGEVTWACRFRLFAWGIWKNYNLFLFQGITWNPNEIVKISDTWAKQYFLETRENFMCGQDHVVE